MQKIWNDVDAFFGGLLAPENEPLLSVLAANAAAGLPAHDVSPLQGKLLELLVRISGARRVLEIGTLGGYSTIWIARALPAGGKIITLELSEEHAQVARENLERSGVLERVEMRTGRAIDTLVDLEKEDAGAFDLIFIDADKPSNPDYLAAALKLSRPGTVIVADNVVRGGEVADPASGDLNVLGIRRFAELFAAEPRVEATAIQTVGVKGYDGFLLAVVGS